MKLPKEAIAEFQKLYKDKFGIELNAEEALQLATGFLEFYGLISNQLKIEATE